MKQKTILFTLLIIHGIIVQGLDPKTISYMEAELTQTAEGYFYGTINKGDIIEISLLKPAKEENFKWEIIEEYLEIQGKKIQAKNIEKNGLEFSSFELKDISQYIENPKFNIIRKLKIQNKSKVGIGEDYDLQNKIKEYQEYSQATETMESDDKEIIAFATAQFNSNSFLETIAKVSEWVHNNLEYDFENYYEITASAKETFKARKGVCDEFANLTGALLKTKNIPVRYVSGISYDGKVFGNHGWIEAYSPSTGWIPIDSTYAEVGYVDAAHIPFSKTRDSKESTDIITTTKSMKPIEVEVKIGEPKVEIKKIETYEGNTKTKIMSPEKAQPNKTITIKVEVENLTEKNLIVPTQIFAHDDFKKTKTTKITIIKPHQSNIEEWQLITPSKEVENKEYVYNLIATSFDSNFEVQIRISKEGEIAEGEAKATQIVPELMKNTLIAHISFENYTGTTQKFVVKAIYQNNTIAEKEIEVKNITTQEKIEIPLIEGTLTIKITGKKEQTFNLELIEKHETKTNYPNIQTINNQSIIVEEETNKKPIQNELQKNETNFLEEFNWIGFGQITLIALIIVFLIGFLLTKRI